MKKTEANCMLDRFLTELTATLGFKRIERLEYGRSLDGAVGFLSFPSRLDPRGYAAFNCIVAVRIECLAAWLDEVYVGRWSTIGIPIDSIREDDSYTEWTFSNAGELEELRDAILGKLNDIALPFIEHYSKLANLRKAVEPADPKNRAYVGLDDDHSVTVLAAIQLVEGDKRGAMKTLDDALAERKGALPKRWFAIERLRRRLVEAE